MRNLLITCSVVRLMVVAACVVLVASSVTAVTCPVVVDGDVIPFGIPHVDPPDLDPSWDQSQIGLVVERGDGFVDIGLPVAQRQSFGQWGIHGSITFYGAEITDVKDWDNDGFLVEMSTHVRYGLEGGDDGFADIGTEESPVTNGDEVDWVPNSVELEFWLATAGARDCFRIELTSSGSAFMKIDYIDGYRVDDEEYGVGPTSPADTRDYGEWIPLNYLCNVDIEIKPETLNLKSKGVFTAFIDLPELIDEKDIDISTVQCEGAPALKGMMANDGKLIVKFDREDLVGVSPGDAVELTVTGELTNGTPFAGSDTIRVIDKGGKK